MAFMNFFRNNMKLLLYFIILGFIVSLFAGIGAFIINDKQNTVAIVNKQKIHMDEFNKLFENALASQPEIEKTPEKIQGIKIQVIQELMREELLSQEAKKVGTSVSQQEIAMQIMQYPIFFQDGKFSNAVYKQKLQYVIKQTPKEFENNISKFILNEKTKYFIASLTNMSQKEREFEPAQDSYEQKQNILLMDWFKSVASKAVTKVTMKA